MNQIRTMKGNEVPKKTNIIERIVGKRPNEYASFPAHPNRLEKIISKIKSKIVKPVYININSFDLNKFRIHTDYINVCQGGERRWQY